MDLDEILARLEELENPDAVAGMARFGITGMKAWGVSIPHLRAIAKQAGRDHALAQKLWRVNTRETRILAGMIDEPDVVTEKQLDRWTRTFNNWEICDGCCMNLFEKTPYAWDKAVEYSHADEEFVKRTGYVLMARLAVSDKGAPDARFIALFPHIERGAADERNFVKKAVNWALRQIGKRNLSLNKKAVALARKILKQDTPPARWIANDALRELTGPAVQQRLEKKAAAKTGIHR